ncbi:(d)CMP kinase [Verrucomicrobia bacterium LW23]|nr:(d)CMP kinase [Verrucomicrobia bacterium LW23]
MSQLSSTPAGTPHPVIAMDGPAASGKSTVARRIAERLGFTYVNTGSMFRGMTYMAVRELPSLEEAVVSQSVASWDVKSWLEGGEMKFTVNGVDPLPYIRDENVAKNVSPVAAIPAVRLILKNLQRALALEAPLVMEGRDIGTSIFPDTPHKFYIDADVEIRERRRLGEGVVDSIKLRDAVDRARAAAPLRVAEGAVVIDTSHMSVEEVTAAVLGHLREQGISA